MRTTTGVRQKSAKEAPKRSISAREAEAITSQIRIGFAASETHRRWNEKEKENRDYPLPCFVHKILVSYRNNLLLFVYHSNCIHCDSSRMPLFKPASKILNVKQISRDFKIHFVSLYLLIIKIIIHSQAHGYKNLTRP